MGLREIESILPPGFRFHPSDEELICHYLFKKVLNDSDDEGTMIEVDLHTIEPWELPEVAKINENEWYFFSFLDRKYATGLRANRATKSGYWKATGKDRTVYDPVTHAIVGMRKTLVFYRGRAPNGIKTSYVMHEFRVQNNHMPPKENWVLCRVCHKRRGEVEINNSSFRSQSFLEKENGNSMFMNGAQSSSSFPDVNNLMQYNFLDFTPDNAQEFGLFFDAGTEENAVQYGNFLDFSY